MHLLITLSQKGLHSCRFQGSGNQTPKKFPLTLFHIILLLSASCSSPNVLGPRGPLSSMNDGFRLDKWPSIYHRGAPAATTEALLCPFQSRQSDDPAWDLPPPLSGEGYQGCREFCGGEWRWSHFHFHQEALLVCGDPISVLSSQGANPCSHPSSSLQSEIFFFPSHVIHLPVELWESNEIIILTAFCKCRRGRAVQEDQICSQEGLSSSLARSLSDVVTSQSHLTSLGFNFLICKAVVIMLHGATVKLQRIMKARNAIVGPL